VLLAPSLPSDNSATRADRRKDRKRTRIRFGYHVTKGDVDWKKLESAVLGEGDEGLESLGGGCDCSVYGNHGGVGVVGRESESGYENDQVGGMVMKINQVGNQVAGGSCSARFMACLLWVEVWSGSAVLRELRGELGRLDRHGLLQVSCRWPLLYVALQWPAAADPLKRLIRVVHVIRTTTYWLLLYSFRKGSEEGG
jgi:hypothetical protein